MRKFAALFVGILLLPLAASAALTTNLTAFWNFDETTGNASDATGNGNTLTNNNTALFSTGLINNAVYLTRSLSQSLSNPTPSTFSPPTDFTWNVWLYLTDLPSSGGEYDIVTEWSSNASDRSFLWGFYNSAGTQRMEFVTNDGSSNGSLDIAYTAATGAWHMYTIEYVASTKVATFYVDTSLNSTSGTLKSLNPTPVAAFFVGGQANGGSNFNGRIDATGFWGRLLTAPELTTLYNSGAGCQYNFTTCTSNPFVNGLFWNYQWWL